MKKILRIHNDISFFMCLINKACLRLLSTISFRIKKVKVLNTQIILRSILPLRHHLYISYCITPKIYNNYYTSNKMDKIQESERALSYEGSSPWYLSRVLFNS